MQRNRANKFRTPIFKLPKIRPDENSCAKRIARRNMRVHGFGSLEREFADA